MISGLDRFATMFQKSDTQTKRGGKKMSELIGCPSRLCSYGFDWLTGQIGCDSGGGNCFVAGLLNAEESQFHDQKLIDATSKINQILSGLEDDGSGRQASFLKTNHGIVLAWVHHGLEHKPNMVTAESDDATIIRALGLKDVFPMDTNEVAFVPTENQESTSTATAN